MVEPQGKAESVDLGLAELCLPVADSSATQQALLLQSAITEGRCRPTCDFARSGAEVARQQCCHQPNQLSHERPRMASLPVQARPLCQVCDIQFATTFCEDCDDRAAAVVVANGEESKAPREVGVCGPLCLLRHVEGRYQPHEPDESSRTYEAMVHLITAPDSQVDEEPNGVDVGLGDRCKILLQWQMTL